MGGTLREGQKVIELHAHAAETTDQTGLTGVAVSVAGPHRAMAVIDISAVGGDADETYAFKIEGSNTSNSTGFVSAHETDEPALQTATQPTGAQIATIALKPFKWYRHDLDVEGTTPSVTYGVKVSVQSSKQPVAAQNLA